jgi:hypothetical protein
MPPNMRFQPTASLAALASRRLKRGPLGGEEVNGLNAKSTQSKSRFDAMGHQS